MLIIYNMHRMNLDACENQRNLGERSYENMPKTPLHFQKIVECKDASFISLNHKILIGI